MWVEGLDLLGELGPDLAVIPHYDNAEGGTHDTRFCYLGERRLAMLEDRAAATTGGCWGSTSTPACIFDLDAGTASVVGNGVVTVRRAGHVVGDRQLATTLPIGSRWSDLAFRERERRRAAASDRRRDPGRPTRRRPPCTPRSAAWKRSSTRPWRTRTSTARSGPCWSWTTPSWPGRGTPPSPTPASGAGPRCGAWSFAWANWPAPGPADPSEVVGGFVDALLAERAAARQDRRFGDADRIRDALVGLGVEVRDTARRDGVGARVGGVTARPAGG